MKTIGICVLLLLSGCDMSNDEVIREVKKCEEAGMRGMPMTRMWNGRVAEVQCWPRVQSTEEPSL